MHTIFSYCASGPMEQMGVEHWEMLVKAGWILMSDMCVKTDDVKTAEWAVMECDEESAIKSWAAATGLDPYHRGCQCGCRQGSPFSFMEYGDDEPMRFYESVEHRDVAWALDYEEQDKEFYGEDYEYWEVERWRKSTDYAPRSHRTNVVKNDGSERYAWYKKLLDDGTYDHDGCHVEKFPDGSFEIWRKDEDELRYWLSMRRRVEIYEQAKAS